MRLPNAEHAWIPEAKIVDYLLSSTHPLGKLKARFFMALGFHPERPEEMIAALKTLAQTYNVVKKEETPYGTKYVVDGWLESPSGKRARVRTV